jgi:large subunit ribosomal protein L13
MNQIADWHLVNADGKVLGRLASQVAHILRGKHKPTYVPYMDKGDFVIIVNADKITATGNKMSQKTYYRHTGYPGGIKSITLEKLLDKKPTDVLMHAIKGMLPRNSLGRQMLSKLKVYAGNEHPHSAQMPKTLEIK